MYVAYPVNEATLVIVSEEIIIRCYCAAKMLPSFLLLLVGVSSFKFLVLLGDRKTPNTLPPLNIRHALLCY